MALTDTEKSSVRRYCGFPDINRQYDLRLESAMNALSVEGEALVRSLLTQLADLEAGITANWQCLKVTAAGDVRMNAHEAIRTLRHEGRRLSADLHVALDITPRSTPFSERRGRATY